MRERLFQRDGQWTTSYSPRLGGFPPFLPTRQSPPFLSDALLQLQLPLICSVPVPRGPNHLSQAPCWGAALNSSGLPTLRCPGRGFRALSCPAALYCLVRSSAPRQGSFSKPAASQPGAQIPAQRESGSGLPLLLSGATSPSHPWALRAPPSGSINSQTLLAPTHLPLDLPV